MADDDPDLSEVDDVACDGCGTRASVSGWGGLPHGWTPSGPQPERPWRCAACSPPQPPRPPYCSECLITDAGELDADRHDTRDPACARAKHAALVAQRDRLRDALRALVAADTRMKDALRVYDQADDDQRPELARQLREAIVTKTAALDAARGLLGKDGA